MKLNARVLMHLALGTSSLAMLGCDPVPASGRCEEPAVMASSVLVAPAPVQPAAARESGPVGAARFATPPDVLAAPAVAAEAAPAVDPDPEPAATAAKEPKTMRHRWCGRCGLG